MAGKAITLTLPEYTYEQLCQLEKKKNIKKSAIMTLALEKYAREEERTERAEKEKERRWQ